MPGTQALFRWAPWTAPALAPCLLLMRHLARYHTPAFAVAAALLAAFWLSAAPGPVRGVLVVGLAGVVLLLGLPHGALDLFIARRSGLWGRQGGFVRFHLVYLVLAFLVTAAFLLAPVPALAAFLALSLWHFADDWRRLPLPVRVACASVIVLAPSLAHPEAVADIFGTVTGTGAAFPSALPDTVRTALAALIVCAVASAFLHDPSAGVEVATIAVLAVLLPPLVFFAAYFTLLHGPRHMIRHAGLIRSVRSRLLLGLYTLAALGIVMALGVALGEGGDPNLGREAIRALFVGLAALTVPHALLIEYDKTRRRAAATGTRRRMRAALSLPGGVGQGGSRG